MNTDVASELRSSSDDVGTEQADVSAPDNVEVKPRADDKQIAQRLEKILQATKWFREPSASVDNGVVFLQGRTSEESFKKWAGDLGRNTRDVVAVVNRIEVDPPAIWDSSYVRNQLATIGRSLVRALPLVVFAVVVLTIAYLITKVMTRLLQRSLAHRLPSQLLRKTAARAVGVVIFLLALYLVLQVAGLTRLALTLAGGTGVVGLALGIAFKDITENFLASIYLSIQKPFEVGDLVQVDGALGYVQRVTARTTILMTLDGNHVQIPNATVFKNSLRNFTSNPNRRVDFVVGVGYDDPIIKAQTIAMEVLRGHEAVLQDPEPWVLVDALGSSTVNLRIYFWLDGRKYSWLKVQSAVIRLIKGAFQDAGISLPDEAREILFPHGVPVQLIGDGTNEVGNATSAVRDGAKSRITHAPESSASENNLSSEAADIESQARRSRLPEAGENLLTSTPLPKSGASDDS